MPIDGGGERVYALGRECKLTIEDREIKGASDVSVRVSASTVDGTGYNDATLKMIPVQWSMEISFSCPDIDDAKYVRALRFVREKNGFIAPRIVSVGLEGGVWDYVLEYDGTKALVEVSNFIIHDIEADEPINGAVIPRFFLRPYRGATRNIDAR